MPRHAETWGDQVPMLTYVNTRQHPKQHPPDTGHVHAVPSVSVTTSSYVPVPDDATAGEWECWDHPDDYRRLITYGPEWTIAGVDPGNQIAMQLQGQQEATGHVDGPFVVLDGSGWFTAAQARMVAAELLNMADQLD